MRYTPTNAAFIFRVIDDSTEPATREIVVRWMDDSLDPAKRIHDKEFTFEQEKEALSLLAEKFTEVAM